MKLLIAFNFVIWGVWCTWLCIGIWRHFPGEWGTNLFLSGTLLACVSFPAFLHLFED